MIFGKVSGRWRGRKEEEKRRTGKYQTGRALEEELTAVVKEGFIREYLISKNKDEVKTNLMAMMRESCKNINPKRKKICVNLTSMKDHIYP